jgi:hypothetical protein
MLRTRISSYQGPPEGASRIGSMVALVEAADDNDHEQGANPCPQAEVGAAECGPHDEKPELEEASYRAC